MLFLWQTASNLFLSPAFAQGLIFLFSLSREICNVPCSTRPGRADLSYSSVQPPPRAQCLPQPWAQQPSWVHPPWPAPWGRLSGMSPAGAPELALCSCHGTPNTLQLAEKHLFGPPEPGQPRPSALSLSRPAWHAHACTCARPQHTQGPAGGWGARPFTLPHSCTMSQAFPGTFGGAIVLRG